MAKLPLDYDVKKTYTGGSILNGVVQPITRPSVSTMKVQPSNIISPIPNMNGIQNQNTNSATSQQKQGIVNNMYPNLNQPTPTPNPAPIVPTIANNTGASNPQVSPVQGQTQTQPTQYDPMKILEDTKAKNIDMANKFKSDSDALAEQKKAQDLERLKAVLESRKSSINSNIAGARDKFQPQREQVDVRRAQDLQRAKEMLAAQGIMGGDNLTTQMNINTQASDNISGINQSEEQYKRNLEEEARQLQYASDAEQAQAISKYYDDLRTNLTNNANTLANTENSYMTGLANAIKQIKDQENTDRTFNLDEAYKKGTLINTADKNLQDYNVEMGKVKNTADKNIWDAKGYMMPEWAKQPIPEEIINIISPYSDNYAQLAKDLEKTNPELSQWAKIAGIQKMFKDDNLLKQYGQQYMTRDMLKDTADINYKNLQSEGQYYDNFIKQAKAEVAPQLEALGLKKLANDVDNGNIENAIKSVEYQYLEPTLQAKIKDIYNAMANRDRNTDINAFQAQDASDRGWANYNLAKDKANNETDTDYNKRIDTTLDSISTGFSSEYSKKKDSNGNALNLNSLMSKVGSVERKALFDRMATAIEGTDISDLEKTKKLSSRGFTQDEIKRWLIK